MVDANQYKNDENNNKHVVQLWDDLGDSDDDDDDDNEGHILMKRSVLLANCVVPMSPNSHKGSSGRIGVLGGSARYTGAPYYASMAALHVGADLANVFCADEAALPIKCYSPELMVLPVYNAAVFDQQQQQMDDAQDEESKKKILERSEHLVQRMVQEVVSTMDRLHVLVIGPGLGRCPLVLRATARIIQEARKRQLALVLDADGLFLLTLPEYRTILQGYPKAILTPNRVEYQRLLDANDGVGKIDMTTLHQVLDQTILVIKGQHDQVIRMNAATAAAVAGDDKEKDEAFLPSLICAEEGGLKRSGGIGDVLAGTIATCVAWQEVLQKQRSSITQSSATDKNSIVINSTLTASQSTTDTTSTITDWLIWSCWMACCITKRATKRAFDIKRRAMTAPDILNEIGATVEDMTKTTTTTTITAATTTTPKLHHPV